MDSNFNKTFGYIRVSSKDQNLARQIDSLRQYVANERDIFADKLSGKDFNRPAYQALKNVVRPGDTIYIHEMERLGRNKEEIKNELEYFKNKGVFVRILNLPTTLIDYTQFDSKMQQTLMEMVNNILIEVLATMAETERENIRKRQAEGIAAAKLRGVKLGRESIPKPEGFDEIAAQWKKRGCTSTEVAESLGISRSLLYKWLREYGTFD